MRFGATLVLVIGLLLTCGNGRGQDVPLSEYQVKAAFIFNFAKFIEWPPPAFSGPEAPMCIGVLGDSALAAELEKLLRDKKVNNRAIVAKECRTEEEIKSCHVLFVGASESRRLPELLQQLGQTNVLTVSETENFIRDGGMINLYREGNKFRFQINDQAARNAGLKIASKLLELSRKPTA
jgi:hypothetical protein